jgi:hypothetical protein
MIQNILDRKKGINSTIALVITIAVGLMVVVIIITLVTTNTGNLETWANDAVPGGLWAGGGS